MSAPKHLWSGDWERESEALSEELAGRRPVAPPPQPPTVANRPPVPPRQQRGSEPERRSKRRRFGPVLAVALATALVLAGAGYGISQLVGGSSPSIQAASAPTATAVPPNQNAVPPNQNRLPPGQNLVPPNPNGSASTQTGPVTSSPIGPPIEWLGMQLEGFPPGTVVVATVAPGSGGEQAGLDPGDVLVAINGHPINATSDVASAISGMHSGEGVQIEVSRGSTSFTTRATLGAPPSSHP